MATYSLLKSLHRRLLLVAASVVLICLLVGVSLAAVCGPDRVLAPDTTGYTIAGKFAIEGTPRMRRASVKAVKAESQDILLWGSWVNDDKHTGRLVSPTFQAPALLGLFVAGWPNVKGNGLRIERTDTGEQFKLKVGNMTNRWTKLQWILPFHWYGRPVRVVAIDENQDNAGWLGMSSPLQVSLLGLLKSQIASIALAPLYLVYFSLFLAPGLLIARVIVRRQHLHKAFTVILAIAVSCLIGYLTFWVYFLNHIVGIVFSAGVLLAAVGYGVERYRRGAQGAGRRVNFEVDVFFPLLLMLTVGLAYVSILYVVSPGDGPETLAQVRFLDNFPPDNILPYLFTEKLYAGKDPRSLFGDWLSSDRPPLQTGIVLLQRPLSLLSGPRVGFYYQILGTIAQCSWIAALWALGRTLRLTGWQLATVLSFSIFSGFFFFNSVYVWPKLLSAALVVFAFTLLVPSVYESRRPTAIEVALAAGATALGMLAHGGVVFTVPAIALMLVRPRSFPAIRQILIGCAVFGLILAPWTAYQKFYEPPANRLVKWHIGGVMDVDSRSVGQTLRDSYGSLSLAQIAHNKWENAAILLDKPTAILESLPESSRDPLYTRREKEFFHVLTGLSVLNVGWFVWLLSSFWQRLRVATEIKRTHLVLGVSLLSLMVWLLAMFGPATTVIHQGSYATMLLLFAGLATLLTKLPRWIVYFLLSLQIVLFLMIWVITTSFGSGDRLIVAPNVFLLGLAISATVGMIWGLRQLVKSGRVEEWESEGVGE